MSVTFSSILCHSFLVRTALHTVEAIYLSRFLHLMCPQCLYESSYSGKSMDHLQGGPTAPGGGTHMLDWEVLEKRGCCSESSLGTSLGGKQPQAAECTQCLQEPGSKCRAEQEWRWQPWELCPSRGFPTLLWSPALCCCLPPSPGDPLQSPLWGISKGGYKAWALSHIKIKFWNSLPVQLPRPRLPLQDNLDRGVV